MLPQRSIILLSVFVAIVFIVFTIISFGSAEWNERGSIAAAAKMEFAFTWTIRMAGLVLTVIAAVHLIRFVGERGCDERVVPSAIALLGSLLVLGYQHWSVVVAFATLVVAYLIQQLIEKSRQPLLNSAPTSPPVSSTPEASPDPNHSGIRTSATTHGLESL